MCDQILVKSWERERFSPTGMRAATSFPGPGREPWEQGCARGFFFRLARFITVTLDGQKNKKYSLSSYQVDKN